MERPSRLSSARVLFLLQTVPKLHIIRQLGLRSLRVWAELGRRYIYRTFVREARRTARDARLVIPRDGWCVCNGPLGVCALGIASLSTTMSSWKRPTSSNSSNVKPSGSVRGGVSPRGRRSARSNACGRRSRPSEECVETSPSTLADLMPDGHALATPQARLFATCRPNESSSDRSQR